MRIKNEKFEINPKVPSFLFLNLAPWLSQTSSIRWILFFFNILINLLFKPLNPWAWVKNTAKVFFDIFFRVSSIFKDRFDKLISTNTGLKPFIITELISETQVNGGTIISFLFLFLFKYLRIEIDMKLAEEPEFTKVEYFSSHFDQRFSNSLLFWLS